jgi:gluconokinase
MGVTGSGKSTLACKIAKDLDGVFVEGDDFHSDANIQKMKSGVGLTDNDREQWLKDLQNYTKDIPLCFLACSCLKKRYRENFPKSYFVHLNPSKQELLERLNNRMGHFASSSLLDSQFADLELLSETENIIKYKTYDELIMKIQNIINSN